MGKLGNSKLLAFFIKLLSEGEFADMQILDKCPRCKSKTLYESENFQYCGICRYWTKKGTARIDSIMVFA
ncbi:hypothetical protein Metev_1915 [Methanohalobium evestigatum Z-7303]|uniref:Uncharacterized protein n=1 Tax=Methanohalobium evestigatum (strain ATCC BAA-1072 / DSM 3721 / NBRC 107634 / OCM 161 / Z-7303) TaxID=644295 RepID=D7EA75_METEZ|nr:hypothetical protein Metev_1915 [Methanohalobium evestigatum Z-7303]